MLLTNPNDHNTDLESPSVGWRKRIVDGQIIYEDNWRPFKAWNWRLLETEWFVTDQKFVAFIDQHIFKSAWCSQTKLQLKQNLCNLQNTFCNISSMKLSSLIKKLLEILQTFTLIASCHSLDIKSINKPDNPLSASK